MFHRDIKPDNLDVREAPGDRRRHLMLFDSAAGGFAVAATLFEMATGARPEFGAGAADPAPASAEVHILPGEFEPEVAEAMTGFFRQALAPGWPTGSTT